jgi:hypothetical protein
MGIKYCVRSQLFHGHWKELLVNSEVNASTSVQAPCLFMDCARCSRDGKNKFLYTRRKISCGFSCGKSERAPGEDKQIWLGQNKDGI